MIYWCRTFSEIVSYNEDFPENCIWILFYLFSYFKRLWIDWRHFHTSKNKNVILRARKILTTHAFTGFNQYRVMTGQISLCTFHYDRSNKKLAKTFVHESYANKLQRSKQMTSCLPGEIDNLGVLGLGLSLFERIRDVNWNMQWLLYALRITSTLSLRICGRKAQSNIN